MKPELRSEILRLYVDERLTLRQVGERVGLTACGVHGHLQSAGIKGRTPTDYKSAPKTKPARPTLADRFWAKVEKTDSCWIWRGALRNTGYGQISVGGRNGKPRKAHRVAWEITNGPIPDGLFVCHHCDNRPCVRPDHLFLGTVRDNAEDARAKGRLRQGDTHPSRLHPERLRRGEQSVFAKLTDEQVRAIRATPRGTFTLRGIAKRYGVTSATIGDVLQGRTWRHVV